mmetsp:Transcript_32026/g.66862  ORF Transcript_32026/g.66862 Transcript_32026/m.66862 type:complete len:706 (-) Transcript_32026:258-2375(-)
MPRKAQVLFRRWFHHRTRSEYRELLPDEAKKDEQEKLALWTTVPGLIVEEDETFLSVEDDAARNYMSKAKSEASSTMREPVKRATSDEAIDRMHDVVQRISRSESFETLETEEESDLAEHDLHTKIRTTTIRWADHVGQKLSVRHEIEFLPPLNVRVVILMLNPAEKIFEFVQCEFQTDERLTVVDLLSQLPFMASMDALKKQKYTSLYRGEREMVNIISIQDYDIAEGEILVAVAAGFNPKHSVAAAAALLLQRSLLRAVQKAKLSGRALQKLMSSEELAFILDGEDPGLPVSPLDDDDDCRDDSRLIIRVLDKELGIPPSQSNKDEDDEKKDDCQDEIVDSFSFLPVPELEDDDFQLFQHAIQIDPYSPVARGRMENLPQNFLDEELDIFEPPFDIIEEDNSGYWHDVSSDEEIGDELEPEPVESMASSDGDEDPQEILMIQEEYMRTAAFFSDVSDTDEDDYYDDNIPASGNRAGGFLVLQPPSVMVSSMGATGIDRGFRGDYYESEIEEEMEPIPEIPDEFEVEPIPIISEIEGSETDDLVGQNDEKRQRNKQQQQQQQHLILVSTQGVSRDLSRISEMDTLEEDTTMSHKLSEESIAALPVEDDEEEVPPIPEFDDLSDLTESDVSDIPDIDECSFGSKEDTATEVSIMKLSPAERGEIANETAALFAVVALLVGAVYKIASVATRSSMRRREYLEEAEV